MAFIKIIVSGRNLVTAKRTKRQSKKLSIEDRIIPIEDVSTSVTALLYGRTGTGKTTIAGTFPTPILLIDVGEKGTDSISDIEGVEVFKVESWEDFEDLYTYIEDNPDEYKTVIIDALHTLQDVCLIKVLHDENKEWGHQVTMRNYGQLANMMKKWLLAYRDLRDLDINVVMLAHDRVTEVEEEEEDNQLVPEVGPRLSPAIASFVLGGMNVVGNTFIRENVVKTKGKKKTSIEYCLRLGPNKYYSTRIRSPKKVEVPSYIVDPTYNKLVSIIKGEKSKPRKSKRVKKRRR